MQERVITFTGARGVDRRRDRWLAAVLWVGLLVVLFTL